MNTKGQSLVELVMVLPLMIAFWAALVWFAQVLIVSIELMHTARHGIFWLAYHEDSRMSASQETQRVTQECTAFLERQAPSLDIGQIQISVFPGDQWHPLGPKNLVDIPGIIDLMGDLRQTLKAISGLVNFRPASVKVEYALAAPPLLRIIPGFPPTIPLRGYCVCYR